MFVLNSVLVIRIKKFLQLLNFLETIDLTQSSPKNNSIDITQSPLKASSNSESDTQSIDKAEYQKLQNQNPAFHSKMEMKTDIKTGMQPTFLEY
jgi:hypothetical protein